MSREIKFRAWVVTGSFWYITNTDELAKWRHDPSSGAVRDLSDLKWQQYTGLKDKNGREIYEGDVLHCGDMDELPLTVKWRDDRHGWGFSEEEETFFDYHMDGFEVIGNIHENPELIQ